MPTDRREPLPYSAACERNQGPILEHLREHFAGVHSVLEIGSGTGQHAVYFARHLPHLRWQPTEQPAKHDVRPPVHKRPRAEPREYDQPGFAQWNYGYRGGNNSWNNSGSNNRALSGGPKSWF